MPEEPSKHEQPQADQAPQPSTAKPTKKSSAFADWSPLGSVRDSFNELIKQDQNFR